MLGCFIPNFLFYLFYLFIQLLIIQFFTFHFSFYFPIPAQLRSAQSADKVTKLRSYEATELRGYEADKRKAKIAKP